jgi:uncharacterized protein (TIGR03067 family)
MRFAAFLVLTVVSGLVLTFAGSMGVAAPVPKHLMKEGDNPEQLKLQGKWKLESKVVKGIGTSKPDVEILEIRDNKLTITNTDTTFVATFKLDAVDGVKRCNASDHQRVHNESKLATKEDDYSLGYSIDGDKLTMATRYYLDNGKLIMLAVDPSKPGKDAIVMVFTRVKDKN